MIMQIISDILQVLRWNEEKLRNLTEQNLLKEDWMGNFKTKKLQLQKENRR